MQTRKGHFFLKFETQRAQGSSGAAPPCTPAAPAPRLPKRAAGWPSSLRPLASPPASSLPEYRGLRLSGFNKNRRGPRLAGLPPRGGWKVPKADRGGEKRARPERRMPKPTRDPRTRSPNSPTSRFPHPQQGRAEGARRTSHPRVHPDGAGGLGRAEPHPSAPVLAQRRVPAASVSPAKSPRAAAARRTGATASRRSSRGALLGLGAQGPSRPHAGPAGGRGVERGPRRRLSVRTAGSGT